jgi:hypothetical protein
MAAGSTYTPIATTTLSSTVSDYTFTSIPNTYTDLVLVSTPLTTGNAAMLVRFNSDTDTTYIYSQTFMEGDGTSASSSRSTGQASYGIGYSSANTTPYTSIAQFMNYSNTTTFKTSLSRSSAAGVTVLAYANLWRSTAAISAIKIFLSGSNSFTAGTTFTLYGIASA